MKQTGPVDTLTVITAGPVPPNASELVMNDRLDPFLQTLRADFDFVILDTPPMLLITDALLLMSKVDTGLLVTNTQKATKRVVEHLEDLLNQNNLSHASLVMNNIQSSPEFRMYYAKNAFGSYGYGYGYGGTTAATAGRNTAMNPKRKGRRPSFVACGCNKRPVRNVLG